MPRWSAERRAPFAKGAPLKQSSMQRKLVCWRQLVRLSALRFPSLSRGVEMGRQANPAPFKQYGRRSVG